MRLLWLTLCTRGFGETQLAVTIGRELESRGHDVFFVSASSSKLLLEGYGVEHSLISKYVGRAADIYIDRVHRTRGFDAILLGDYSTAAMWFTNSGLDASFLSSYDVPIVGIDTWCMALTGDSIDTYWRATRRIADWRNLVTSMLVPVPLGPSTSVPNRFSTLPEVSRPSAASPRSLRKDLGIGDREKLILFCTGDWQHARYPCRHAERLAVKVPQLLYDFVARLGPATRLVHVGPQPFELDDAPSYLWLDQMQHARFDRLLAASDLLLCANVSANTIGKAMTLGIPALCLVNRYEVESRADAREQFPDAPDHLRTWLEAAVPIFSFLLWPIGFWKHLNPLAQMSEYFQVLERVEILHHDEVMDCFDRLLFDASARQAVISRQHEYVASLDGLPSAASLIEATLEDKAGIR